MKINQQQEMEINQTNIIQKESRELEEAIVSALLIESTALAEVTALLTPRMFSSPDTAFIYQAIMNQYEQGIAPDLLTTEAEMKKIDFERFQAMQGIASMAHSLSRIRHSDNLIFYAREVKRYYLLRSLQSLFYHLMAKASLCETDPAKLLRETDTKILDISKNMQEGDEIKNVSTLITEVIEIHRKRNSMQLDERIVFSGLIPLDAIFCGFHRRELYIIGGRPSHGKTAVCMQIAINAARAGKKVYFCSLEMSDLQSINRILAGQLNISSTHLRLSELSPYEFGLMEKLADEWKELPLFFDFTPGNSAANIRAKTQLMARRHGCDMVIVDYLQLMETDWHRREENSNTLIGRNSTALKRLAQEANCPVLAISQMNRNVENRQQKNFVPNNSDLRDSGVIEQDADGIFFVQNPRIHNITKDEVTGESLEGFIRIYVTKNRNGKIGIVKIKYNETFTRFE